MLAHTCGDDCLALGQLHEEFDHILGLDGIGRVLVTEGVILLPLGDLLVPGRETGMTGLHGLVSSALKLLVEARKGILHIPKNGKLHRLILVDFGVIDVDVDDRSVLAEFLYLPGDAVVKADANRQQEISLVDGIVRVNSAVHTEPLEGEGMIFRERSDPHEGGGDGNLAPFSKLGQLLGCIGGDHATTAVDHWLLGRGNQPEHLV